MRNVAGVETLQLPCAIVMHDVARVEARPYVCSNVMPLSGSLLL
jgi:hypothetical protein